MSRSLEDGFALDEQWHWLRGEMEQNKKPALLSLARVLGEAAVPYAIIGGVALQVHQDEPRTTIDIDLAVIDRAHIPVAALEQAGFRRSGSFAHSDNWIGPAGTPVQFTDDGALRAAVARAEVIDVDGVPLRVIGRADLLHEKLRAGADPARRRSKRLQDLADAERLVEQHPSLREELSAGERLLLDRLPL
jgi:hypothetical protein